MIIKTDEGETILHVGSAWIEYEISPNSGSIQISVSEDDDNNGDWVVIQLLNKETISE